MRPRSLWQAMLKSIGKLLKPAVTDFIEDRAITLSAALAFYALLSLAPLLIVLTALIGLIDPTMQRDIARGISEAMGPRAGEIVSTILANAPTPDFGSLMSVLGVLVLVFAGAGVFGQLQGALNQIWEVQPRPGLKLATRIRQRAMPFLMLFLLGALMIAGVLASWLLRLLLPQGSILRLADLIAGLLLFTLLFGLLFKVLPDTRIRWSDVWVGALVTAVLFVLARWAMGFYFSYSTIGSAYGAAGSLVLMLIMVYYSFLIMLFGAELTQVYARRYGHQIQPKPYAVRLQQPGATSA